MLEEDVVRHQARHRDDGPAGAAEQPFVELVELRDARAREAEKVEPATEAFHSAARKHLLLAGEEKVPHVMLLAREPVPILRHRPVGGRAGGGLLGSLAAPWRSWAGVCSSSILEGPSSGKEKPRSGWPGGVIVACMS
jgi:hypothetical protein